MLIISVKAIYLVDKLLIVKGTIVMGFIYFPHICDIKQKTAKSLFEQ